MQHLSKLRIFHAVAELGSLTRAADALAISKSTVSRAITELEQAASLKLLNRSSRQLVLTQEGQQLYRRCESIANEYEAAFEELSDRSLNVGGRLRVCLPTLFGQFIVGPALPEFLSRFPALKVQLELRHTTIADLDSRTELAVIYGALDNSAMVGRRLGDCSHVICATPAYLSGKAPIRSPLDLQSHACILLTLPNIHNSGRWHFNSRQSGAAVTVSVREYVSTNDTLMAKQIMMSDAGVCALPDYAVKEELAAGTVVSVLDDYRLPATPVYAVYHSRSKNSPRIKVFVEYLERLLMSEP